MRSFKQYLSEGITHIEDLDLDSFIGVITRLSKFIATEKLDGAALTFGIDDGGELFCSRQQKGSATRRYDPEEWGDSAAMTGFKSAHQALRQIAPLLKPVLPANTLVEVEVLFGAQPNAIIYGSSCIAFLRALSPDSDSIIASLKGIKFPTVTIDTKLYTSTDGETVINSNEPVTWRFVTPQQLDTQQLSAVDFSEQISQLNQYLDGTVDLASGSSPTIRELIALQSRAPEIVALKKQIGDVILHNFKLPIKQELLIKFVRTLTPSLRDVGGVDKSIDPGVEGVVLFDPATNTQVKIVDKDVFTAFNNFNFAIRGQLKSSMPKQVADELRLIDTRTGSVYTDLLKTLSEIFEYDQLARPTMIRKFLATTPDFSSLDVSSVRSDVVSALEHALRSAKVLNTNFKQHVATLRLQLADSREFKYSPEIINRTLTMSAEIITDIQSMIAKVSSQQTTSGVIGIIYKSYLTNK
jgi:hypothetical protein